MSSFLSAIENIARQRQNVRRDLKKRWRKKAELLSWRCRVIIWFIFGLCCTGKKVSITVRLLYLYFGTIVTLLALDSVVSWSLIMMSSAAR